MSEREATVYILSGLLVLVVMAIDIEWRAPGPDRGPVPMMDFPRDSPRVRTIKFVTTLIFVAGFVLSVAIDFVRRLFS